MTQVVGSHVPPVAVPPQAPPAPARVIDLTTAEDAAPPVVLRAPHPRLAVTALAAAVVASTAAVVVAASARGGAAVAAAAGCAAVAGLLLLLAAAGCRWLAVSDDGVERGGFGRRREHAWDTVARVEVTARGRRRACIVLSEGRRIVVPRAATRAGSAGLSPLDRGSARAGAAGVAVIARPSSRPLWLWGAVVAAGVVAGLAVGVWLAGLML